jgi:hypothetical protein
MSVGCVTPLAGGLQGFAEIDDRSFVAAFPGDFLEGLEHGSTSGGIQRDRDPKALDRRRNALPHGIEPDLRRCGGE